MTQTFTAIVKQEGDARFVRQVDATRRPVSLTHRCRGARGA